MRNLRKLTALMLMFIMVSVPIFLYGCAGESKEKGQVYSIYYKKASQNVLEKRDYRTETTDLSELAFELAKQMNQVDKKEELFVLKPYYVNLLEVSVVNEIANVFFDKSYYDMENVDEILYRAGLIKTITQIEGVKYIQIYVDGVTARYDDGTDMGLLSNDYLADDADGIDKVKWEEVSFYYGNKTGDRLIRKKEMIPYAKNISIEKAVMERLIEGTTDSNYSSTLPSTMKLLSISVSSGVCYVNFDSVFFTEMVNVSADVAIYSIVNTLCGLKDIESVKIMVNGDSTKTFRESIKLDQNFQFNKNIIDS